MFSDDGEDGGDGADDAGATRMVGGWPTVGVAWGGHALLSGAGRVVGGLRAGGGGLEEELQAGRGEAERYHSYKEEAFKEQKAAFLEQIGAQPGRLQGAAGSDKAAFKERTGVHPERLRKLGEARACEKQFEAEEGEEGKGKEGEEGEVGQVGQKGEEEESGRFDRSQTVKCEVKEK